MIAQDGHLDFHAAPELCGNTVRDQCRFTSTETVRTIRDEEPRTATSTFTQHLSFVLSSRSVLLYVHRDRTDYLGRGAQDGHFADFRTAHEPCGNTVKVQVECCFTSTGTISLTSMQRDKTRVFSVRFQCSVSQSTQ